MVASALLRNLLESRKIVRWWFKELLISLYIYIWSYIYIFGSLSLSLSLSLYSVRHWQISVRPLGVPGLTRQCWYMHIYIDIYIYMCVCIYMCMIINKYNALYLVLLWKYLFKIQKFKMIWFLVQLSSSTPLGQHDQHGSFGEGNWWLVAYPL